MCLAKIFSEQYIGLTRLSLSLLLASEWNWFSPLSSQATHYSCKDYTLLCPTGSIRPGRRRIMDCFSKLFCNILSYPLSEWVPNTEGEQSTVKWTISIKNSWQKTTCCDFLGDQDVLLWRFPATQLLLHRTVLNFKNITLFRILFI